MPCPSFSAGLNKKTSSFILKFYKWALSLENQLYNFFLPFLCYIFLFFIFIFRVFVALALMEGPWDSLFLLQNLKKCLLAFSFFDWLIWADMIRFRNIQFFWFIVLIFFLFFLMDFCCSLSLILSFYLVQIWLCVLYKLWFLLVWAQYVDFLKRFFFFILVGNFQFFMG